MEGACRNCGQTTLQFLDDLKQADKQSSIQDTQDKLKDIIETATVAKLLLLLVYLC